MAAAREAEIAAAKAPKVLEPGSCKFEKKIAEPQPEAEPTVV